MKNKLLEPTKLVEKIVKRLKEEYQEAVLVYPIELPSDYVLEDSFQLLKKIYSGKEIKEMKNNAQ